MKCRLIIIIISSSSTIIKYFTVSSAAIKGYVLSILVIIYRQVSIKWPVFVSYGDFEEIL